MIYRVLSSHVPLWIPKSRPECFIDVQVGDFILDLGVSVKGSRAIDRERYALFMSSRDGIILAAADGRRMADIGWVEPV